MFKFFAVVIGLVALGAFMTWWTTMRMPGKSYSDALPDADEPLRTLAAELRRDVTHLAEEIGERNVLRYPAELSQAADWLESEFANAGYDAKRQEYQTEGISGCVNCCNIEVEIPGKSAVEEIVVVGAHYDSVVGTAGANDNSTGVAAMLAMARRLANRDFNRTLRFVAFVNEEPPYFQTDEMGSRVYARRCKQRGENVVAMLSLETIGCYDDTPGSQQYPIPLASSLYPSEGNFILLIGNLASGDLVRSAVGTFRENEQFPCEGGVFPEAITGVGFSDQWSFWQEGYPALMVTDTAMFRYPYYHTPEDTVDKIDFDRTARVVRGLTEVVSALVGDN